MKIDIKQSKCKRKVFILNYKWKTFILSKGSTRNIEKLKITVPCNTESSKDEIKRYNLSILKPNIKERIVPKCFRHKCRKDCYKDHHFREQQIKTKINKNKYIHSMKFRNENLLYPELKYDDISSGSLSSYEDIETLMSSTRTRMKELKDRWELFPASTNLNKNIIKGSINSLDKISFGNEFHEDTIKIKRSTRSIFSPTLNMDMNIETKNVMSKSDISDIYTRCQN